MSTSLQPADVSAQRVDGELSGLAKALGNPARVRILRLLLARDSCFCGEIVEHLPLAQATASHHLKVLKDARLIVGEIDGPRTCNWADRDRLARLHQLLGGMLAESVQIRQGAACGGR